MTLEERVRKIVSLSKILEETKTTQAYKKKFNTFSEYCDSKGFSEDEANAMIAASKVLQNLLSDMAFERLMIAEPKQEVKAFIRKNYIPSDSPIPVKQILKDIREIYPEQTTKSIVRILNLAGFSVARRNIGNVVFCERLLF